MEYIPFKETIGVLQENNELKYVLNFSVLDYFKNYIYVFCSNEMCSNHTIWKNKNYMTSLFV
jgi:hypothetical protein